MPSRYVPFVNGEYYHVFNRGVMHIPIYTNASDYKHFLHAARYYQVDGPRPRFSFFDPKKHSLRQNKKIVNIVSYCFMPNHFHFLLQQMKDGGVTEFVGKLSNSYTKYINTKYKRDGHLLQGTFKSVYVETNEQLLHLSRYIHLNPLVGYLVKDLGEYPWSSFHEYVGSRIIQMCDKEVILGQFKSKKEYRQFLLDQEDYGKQLEYIKHLTLDYPQV